MDLDTFFSADDDVVSSVVGHTPMTCVLAVNGTRRWFILNHQTRPGEDVQRAYLDKMHEQNRRLTRLFFDHGIDSLVLPVFGSALAARGPEYVREAVRGVAGLCGDEWIEFYARHRVRVRFYGSERRGFDADLQARMAEVEARTRGHSQRRLWFGLGVGPGGDAAEVARLSVQSQAETGQLPDRDTLVTLYYGEILPPARLFIGHGPPCVFDFPLLDDGDCDLYFLASPTPYLDRNALRAVLYDHLYTRRGRDDYGHLRAEDWDRLRRFYSLNRGAVAGIGHSGPGGLWCPLSNLMYPDDLWRLT